MSFLFTDEVDDFRNPEVVAREKQEKRENSVMRRVVDSGLDIANQIMMTAEFSTRAAYRDKENDNALRKDKDFDRQFDAIDRMERDRQATSQASAPRGHGRRSDLDYRTEALGRRVASPSSPENDIQFE